MSQAKAKSFPVVSILVPVYGVEKRIERCAVSLFEQTYGNIEYIFVDDSSKDNSIGVLREVVAHYPQMKDKVRIVSHEHNRGLAAARNTAVDEAEGEFILHVDSDDYLSDKEAVEKLVKKQMETDADIVIFENIVYYKKYTLNQKTGDYSIPKKLCLAQLSGQERHSVWGELIRKTLYADNGIRVLEGYNMAEDYQVTPRLAYFAKRIATLHESLYVYDKTNEISYTYSFSKAKSTQSDKAYDILKDFFHDKGSEYMDAYYKAVLISTIRKMMDSCKDGNHIRYYEEKRRLINSIDNKYYRAIPYSNRIFIKLMWCRPLLVVLCKTTAHVKHLWYMMISKG